MAGTQNQGRTLERALEIINYVGNSTVPLRLSQIANGTGLHLATTQRMVNTLVHRGYLSNNDGNYAIGPAVLTAARGFTLQDKLTAVAFPFLLSLTEHTGLTSSIYVQHEHTRILTARSNAPQAMHYQLPIGEKMDIAFGAGRIFLAHMPSAERDEILSSFGKTVTYADGRTEPTQTVKKTLENILEDGYYLSFNERARHTVALTAPIYALDGALIAAINLVAPHDTTSREEMMQFRPPLLDAAATIGATM